MDSGWILHFEDGGRAFFSEDAYKIRKENLGNKNIVCEEHWLDMDKLIEKYPWVTKLS